MPKYEFTEEQKKFLELLPKWKGDFRQLCEDARAAIIKMDRMVGVYHGSDHTQSTDIGKLMHRVLVPVTELLGNEDTDWVAADLSRCASEVRKANPLFGFGAKGKGEYEARVEAEMRNAESMGLGVSAESLEAAMKLAAELGLGYHRFLEERGVIFPAELKEAQQVTHLKRAAARMILEDAQKGMMEWFESIYLEGYEGEGSLPEPENADDRELRALFFEMLEDFTQRREAVRSLQ